MKIHFPVVLIGFAAATLFAGCGGGGAQMTPPMSAASHQSAAAAPASAGVSSDPLLGQVPATTYISKARAEYIALRAVGGGTVTLAVLETAATPCEFAPEPCVD